MNTTNFHEKFNVWNDTTISEDAEGVGDGRSSHGGRGQTPVKARWVGEDEYHNPVAYEGFVTPNRDGEPEKLVMSSVNGQKPDKSMDMADAIKSLRVAWGINESVKGKGLTPTEQAHARAQRMAEQTADRLSRSLDKIGTKRAEEIATMGKRRTLSQKKDTLDAIHARGGLGIERNQAVDEMVFVNKNPDTNDDVVESGTGFTPAYSFVVAGCVRWNLAGRAPLGLEGTYVDLPETGGPYTCLSIPYSGVESPTYRTEEEMMVEAHDWTEMPPMDGTDDRENSMWVRLAETPGPVFHVHRA